MMLGWNRRRKQLLEEFETHIEIETQENIDAGMEPEEARHAARRKFGNVLMAAEESRVVWGGVWLERLLQDVRYAVRSLRGVPVYTGTLICTLVLGLGSATTMLAIVDSVLLRPVALPHPEQLVEIYSQDEPNGTHTSDHALSYGVIDEMRRSAHSFSGVAGYNTMVQPVTAADGARITELVEVTQDFFSMMGARPRAGRLIVPADAQAPVVVVSDGFWRERLHADAGAVGSGIKVGGRARTVIGILPAGVHVLAGTGGQEVYVPVSLNAKGEDEFKIESAMTLARLRPGVSSQQAMLEARGVFAHSDKKYGEVYRHLAMRPYRDLVVGDMEKPLLTILGGVGVLLLIACANAANLQIGRAASRMQEIATRQALGASFARLLQQLVTESVLVSLVGAVLGGALSYAAIAYLRRAYGGEFARFDELAVHPLVLACTGMLAIVAGVVASVAPLWNIRHQAAAARIASRNTTSKMRLPGLLVSLQVSLTCVLLVISGLFVRSLQSLENVKLGFDPHNVTTLVLIPERQSQDPQISRDIETRLLRRFERLPGVQAVTMQSQIPFSSYDMTLNGATEIAGRPYQKDDAAFYSLVSTNFVQTSGIHLLQGRSFEAADESSASIVVLVNQTFVAKFLGERNPIGAAVRFHRGPGETDADLPFLQPMNVVGVVENEMQGANLGAPYEPMVYLDYLQLPKGSLLGMVFNMAAQYAVRSTLAEATLASELRAAVKQVAPSMVEMSLRPMEEGVAQSLKQRRLALRIAGGFGLVALVLCSVGTYGVLAYSVVLRRREIGIRMALGSTRRRTAGLVMRQAGMMVLAGLIPGAIGAWAAGAAVRSFLYGVKTFDSATVASVGGIFLLVATAAASVPAMRAAHVDPVETLRAE